MTDAEMFRAVEKVFNILYSQQKEIDRLREENKGLHEIIQDFHAREMIFNER